MESYIRERSCSSKMVQVNTSGETFQENSQSSGISDGIESLQPAETSQTEIGGFRVESGKIEEQKLFPTSGKLDFGRPTNYYASLTSITGSVRATIFLSLLLQREDHLKVKNGWILISQIEIKEKTGLTRSEQYTARVILKQRNLIQEKYSGMPRKIYYRLCFEKIMNAWSKIQKQ